MAIKIRHRWCVFVCSLFLISLPLAISYEIEDPTGRETVSQCVSQCQKHGDVQEYLACEKRCELQGREPHHRREEQESPRREFEQCQRRCQSQRGERVQQQRCEQRCQEQLREREQEREHEGGRGRDVNPRDPEREREEQQRRERERREREQREREREEREREREREGGRGRDENPKDPEREREEQQRREQERRERERREREREEREREREHEGGRGRRENPRDPEREREEQQRREQERREQERREREREQRERERGHGGESERDPQGKFEQCSRRCQTQERGQSQQQCVQGCERQRQQDERQQRERRGGGQNEQDPQKQYQQCQKQCQRQEHGQQGQRICQQKCEEQLRERQREHGQEENPRWEEEREEKENPYYFHQRRFQSRFRSEHGHIRVLEKFSERSDLLRGIKNYRFSIIEARPNSFMIPHHYDAESIIFVVKGKGTVSFVWQDKREAKRESYNLERGQAYRISAGTMVYLINKGNEDLQLVKLVQPVNNPGEFKDFYVAGGENPQSYYSVFSNDILEAALNTPSDQLERFFKQRGKSEGAIIRASEEQVRAMSEHVSSPRQAGRGQRGPISLLNERPAFSSKFGKLYEAKPEEFQQLRDVDISVAVSDINQGGMMVPHYNTRSTFVVFVAEGNGRLEMGCPHLSSQHRESHRGREEEGRHRGREEEGRHRRGEEEERIGQFEKVTARLSQGDVFVVPAGHPVTYVASQNENLRLVGFGVNALNNQNHFLAGQENIMNQVEREAKELAFNVQGKEAEQIFKNQRESFFTQGPQRGQRRTHPLASILDTVGFM